MVAVFWIIFAQFVHLGLEHVVVDLVVSQQAFFHTHALDGMSHVDLAGLEQRYAAHVVVHLGEPLGIPQHELVHQRAVELRYEKVALDFGRVFGKALPDDVFESRGEEQKQQVEKLRALGCEVIQGYYYCKPISIEEYENRYL